MEYGLQQEDLTMIKEILSATPGIKQVIIFGSRAMGTYKPGSDIDMAISGDLSFNDLLELNDRLLRLGMLYSFDIQKLSSIKDPDVLDHINRIGKILYP